MNRFAKTNVAIVDINNLPEAINTILLKTIVNKNDQHVIRQFLYNKASAGVNVKPLLKLIEEKYNRLLCRVIWSDKNKNQADLEYRVRGSGKLLFKGSRKPTHHRHVSPTDDFSLDELYHYTNTVIPSEIPGCTALPDGQNALNNKGKRFVRWLCYVMCRLGGDPHQLIKRLERFFDKTLLSEVIDEKALESFEKAYKQHLQEVSGKTDESQDEETVELNRLIHCLSYRDIPGLETFDKWNKSGFNKTRLLNAEVVKFLKNKIRRMFQKQLQFDSFLSKLADMFGSAMNTVFDEQFRQEITHCLLPKYKGGALKCLSQWMSPESSPYVYVLAGGVVKMRQIMPNFNYQFYNYFTNDDLPATPLDRVKDDAGFYINPEPVSFGEGSLTRTEEKTCRDEQICSVSATIPSLLDLQTKIPPLLNVKIPEQNRCTEGEHRRSSGLINQTEEQKSCFKQIQPLLNSELEAKSSSNSASIPSLWDLNTTTPSEKFTGSHISFLDRTLLKTPSFVDKSFRFQPYNVPRSDPFQCSTTMKKRKPLLSNETAVRSERHESPFKDVLLHPNSGQYVSFDYGHKRLNEMETTICSHHESPLFKDPLLHSNSGQFVSFNYNHKRPSEVDRFVSFEREPHRFTLCNRFETPPRPSFTINEQSARIVSGLLRFAQFFNPNLR